MKGRDPTLFVLGVAFVLLLGGTWVVPGWALTVATLALNSALVVLGLLLLMRTGLVSFGQGLFACLGGYTAGVLGQTFEGRWLRHLHSTDALVMVVAGVLISVIVAFVLGLMLAIYRGIFFAMLTLAFSMVLWGLLSRAPGGTDGFRVQFDTIAGIPVAGREHLVVFLASVIFAFVCSVGMYYYLGSYLGRLAPAVRDNELRVEYMGASVRQVVHVNYVIAAGMAGLGGTLIALSVGHVDPDAAYWTTSGDFVFVAILSGTGNVLAPFLGSLLYAFLHSYVYEKWPNTWHLVLGVVLLLIIVFLPGGIWSVFQRWRRKEQDPRDQSSQSETPARKVA